MKTRQLPNASRFPFTGVHPPSNPQMRLECSGSTRNSNRKCHSQGFISLGRGLLRLSLPVARVTWTSPYHLADVYRNIQWSGVTFLEARFDEAPKIFLGRKDHGQHTRLVNQYHPPEPTTSRRRTGSLGYAEDFDRNVVDGSGCWSRRWFS